LEERAARGVHAAVEDHVGVLRLDLGEDRLEVGFLVGGALAAHHVHLVGLQRLLDLVGEALAVGGLVVDEGDLLRLQLVRDVRGDGRALLVVAAHGAEHGLHAALGELRVGGRARDHRDPGLAVDLRGGDRDARVQVAHHGGDLGVHELLGDGRAHLRVGLVVLAHHLERDGLAVDGDLLVVRLRDREGHAVLVVLAEVGDRARERPGVGDGDRGAGRSGRDGGCFGFLGLVLVAARGEAEGKRDCKAQLMGAFHRKLSWNGIRAGMGRGKGRDYGKLPPRMSISAYLRESTHATSFLMSASFTWVLGGMGIWPHTPTPPSFTFFSSLAGADLSPRYLLATSLYEGPTTFLSTAWQARQPLLAARASSAHAGATARAAASAARAIEGFMG